MNLNQKAYQRLIIATDLVKSSVNSLTEMSEGQDAAQETAQDLSVALYELKQLSTDLSILLDSTHPGSLKQQ